MRGPGQADDHLCNGRFAVNVVSGWFKDEFTHLGVAAYRKRGVGLILGGFLHFQEEIEYFSSRVLPLVREIEDSEEDSVDSPVLVSA